MTMPHRSSVTLRALSGTPLENKQVRAIVVSSAWAIGERTGVEVLAVRPHPDRIEIDLLCPRLASIGFAAELRRLTERWYAKKFPDSGHLWGAPPDEQPPHGRGPDADPDRDSWRSEHEDDDDWWKGGQHDLGPPG